MISEGFYLRCMVKWWYAFTWLWLSKLRLFYRFLRWGWLKLCLRLCLLVHVRLSQNNGRSKGSSSLSRNRLGNLFHGDWLYSIIDLLQFKSNIFFSAATLIFSCRVRFNSVLQKLLYRQICCNLRDRLFTTLYRCWFECIVRFRLWPQSSHWFNINLNLNRCRGNNGNWRSRLD